MFLEIARVVHEVLNTMKGDVADEHGGLGLEAPYLPCEHCKLSSTDIGIKMTGNRISKFAIEAHLTCRS